MTMEDCWGDTLIASRDIDGTTYIVYKLAMGRARLSALDDTFNPVDPML